MRFEAFADRLDDEALGALVVVLALLEQAQRRGEFRDSVSPEFAAMAFYGAIEQVLTGWIFGTLDEGGDAHERAKDYVVETICDGLSALSA